MNLEYSLERKKDLTQVNFDENLKIRQNISERQGKGLSGKEKIRSRL